jgi:hypothetical protein
MRARAEALLHEAWRGTTTHDALIGTRSGETFQVIYPGRPSDGRGPDFRDAVLQTSRGALLKGDVEIHVRASDWRRHGHQTDEDYNGVVFHVAADGHGPATSSAGRALPLVVLRGGPGTNAQVPAKGPGAGVPDNGDCAARSAPAHALNASDLLLAGLLPRMPLGEAGDRRFLAKSSGYQIALRGASPDDVMWSAVLEGFGYSRNRRGFRQLAARLPWSTLAATFGAAALSSSELELVLLRAAGLAAEPPAGARLGAAWPAIRPLPGTRPVWARSAGHPLNHPARRIGAAARLAQRWLAAGGPATALESAAMAARSCRDLYRALIVPGSCGEAASLGPGRAAAIVVSAVLPCLHANAVEAGRWHVAERCLALFRSHPKLPSNGVEREALRVLNRAGRQGDARTARGQQGLLYSYRSLTMG